MLHTPSGQLFSSPQLVPPVPAAPMGPAGPVIPAAPMGPAGPIIPAAPDVLAAPVEPAAPDLPAAAVVPAAPDVLAAPVEPAAPDLPAAADPFPPRPASGGTLMSMIPASRPLEADMAPSSRSEVTWPQANGHSARATTTPTPNDAQLSRRPGSSPPCRSRAAVCISRS